MKLHLRVSILIVALLVAIGAVGASFMLLFQLNANTRQFETMASALGQAILDSIEPDLLNADAAHLRAELRRISQSPMVNEIVVIGAGGRIFASAKTEEIGSVRQDPRVEEALQRGESLTRTEVQYGRNELCVITPLANKPECQGCHGTQLAFLGAIEIGLDTASVDEELKEQAIIMVIMGLLTFVFVGGGLTLLLRRTVFAPLARFAASAQRLGGGDYSVRLDYPRPDELGVLASAFNEMATQVEDHAQQLEASRGQLTQLNEELEGRVIERTRQLAILLESSRTLASTLDLDSLLSQVVIQLSQAVGPMEAGLLFLYDEEAQALVPRSCFGCAAAAVEMVRLRPGEAIAGRAFATAQPIFDTDLKSIADAMGNLSPQNARHLEAACPCLTLPRNAVAVPLVSKGQAIGVLQLVNFDHPEEADIELLRGLADQVAIAVDNARLYEEVQRKEQVRGLLLERVITAQEEERKRVARELHDEAGQVLTAVMMSTAAAEEALPRGAQMAKAKLKEARELARKALADVRKIILDLRPEMLDDLGLVPALRWYVKNRLDTVGIQSKLEVSRMKRRFSPQVEATIFRVVQEAVTNIVRHARATTARIRLEVRDGTLHTLIEDDGVGFAPAEVLAAQGVGQGWGLRGMEERVSLLGGSFRVEAAPGQGTRLVVEIPLEEMTNGKEGADSASGRPRTGARRHPVAAGDPT